MRYLAVSRPWPLHMAFSFSTKVFTPAEIVGPHWEIFPNMRPRGRDYPFRMLTSEKLSQKEEFL
jgi:hypothetical protein